ncbi:STAS domain-containing protein [Brevibacillus sp. SYSU BS000544]|uniref:STAS domain-containing protein n=1 Tax=Brevibacillus sp. SYSU BS000544 TaxID=3416443 RepID=UPI003CE4BA92
MSVNPLHNSFGKQSASVRTQRVKDLQKILFEGKLIYGQTEIVKKQVLEMLENAAGYLFDLRQLETIDSTGFGVLINIGKKLKQQNQDMVIIVEDGFVKELLYIAKFNLIFPIAGSDEEAYEMLQQDHPTLLGLDEY